MRVTLIILLVITASFSGFVIHVLTIEWLPQWIGSQIQGIEITASWDVRYVAAITSVEYGLAALGIYIIGRKYLLRWGQLKAALAFSVLLMSIQGLFIRQPLMDFLIGNPWHVVLVQNAFKWLPWLLVAFIIVFGYEYINRITQHKKTC